MKKTTVSLHAPSNEGTADPPSTRSKTPATSKRRLGKPANRQNEASANLRRNGARKHDEDQDQLDVGKVLAALEALKKGDFSTRLPVAWTGIAGKVADSFNGVAELMSNSTE